MGQVVLITGASTGFGWLTAELLARRGFHVSLLCATRLRIIWKTAAKLRGRF